MTLRHTAPYALALLLAVLAPLVAAGSGPSVVIVDDAAYPEGALWHRGALYWAEMNADRVMRRDGRDTVVFWQHDGCGPTSIAPAGDGYVVTCHLGSAIARVGPAGETEDMVPADADGRRIEWPNDSTADAHGGVYFSTSGLFARDAPATGRILYLPAAEPPRVVAEGLHYANGVALSPDGATLYAAEHIGRRILAFAVTAPGTLDAGRTFADFRALPASSGEFPLVGPDGIEVAPDGRVLAAEYGAGRIAIFGPDGTFQTFLSVPEPFVTASSLRPDGALFITAPASPAGTGRGVVRRMTLPAPPKSD